MIIVRIIIEAFHLVLSYCDKITIRGEVLRAVPTVENVGKLHGVEKQPYQPGIM